MKKYISIILTMILLCACSMSITPSIKVSEYLNIDVKKTVKAMLMNVNNELVVFFIRGDRTLNETKVCKLLNC